MSGGRELSTEVVEAGSGTLLLESAELRVVAGPDRGLNIELDLNSISVGTAIDCELRLSDPTVSSRHAEISVGRRGYVIRDLHSKNGVRIGRWPIERARLADGMRLIIGSTTLEVVSLGARHEIPLARPDRFGGLAAYSIKMRAAASALERLAATDMAVLIDGETGTGKEIAARALHAASDRARGPFMVFDCGVASPQLAAAELFGHVKGAFTGAESGRPGLFEEADGGTLLLDEIGELPLELQPLLLRVLERKAARPVGGAAEIPRDVRIVAATNRNLAHEVSAGRFRQDLYFRVTAARVKLPPLRERPEDVPILAGLFAAEAGVALSPELQTALASHDWPGNVRELKNAIERFAVDQDGDVRDLVRGGAVTARSASSFLPSLSDARREAIEAFERRYLAEALARADGNVTRAAELAGVSRQLLTRLLARHGIRGRPESLGSPPR